MLVRRRSFRLWVSIFHNKSTTTRICKNSIPASICFSTIRRIFRLAFMEYNTFIPYITWHYYYYFRSNYSHPKQKQNKRRTMKSKCRTVNDILFKAYGTIDCPLDHKTPFQLMVAVMLSAQCTDKQVNKVTPILFSQYPTSEQLSNISLIELETIIKSTGFYHNKAKNILKTSQIICEKYNCNVPEDIETLVTLPGIGRKTANVIVAQAFNKTGFAVDTHVIRLLNRIGIVNTDNPVKIEFAIRKILPLKLLDNFSLLLITHGRACCTARKPDCSSCIINHLCKSNKI